MKQAAVPRAGFTLIEVLIVVVILGILAAIVIPSYQGFVLRGHRSNAKAVLMETAHFMERYYTANNSYVDAGLPTAVVPRGASGAAVGSPGTELEFAL